MPLACMVDLDYIFLNLNLETTLNARLRIVAKHLPIFPCYYILDMKRTFIKAQICTIYLPCDLPSDKYSVSGNVIENTDTYITTETAYSFVIPISTSCYPKALYVILYGGRRCTYRILYI